ncbi:apolipoprotein N-acyltransferase [Alkalimarinus alittae]|uniref:Apolipoprotein N-acyltransferase n=1 Tax=Alkalimarinus alittae TaxID=2961619 RepID=A0ABY6N000_9ALTE|nr:apolipoprotein N-acyltransferase [Alkalimarinus alittae]UZE95370.1 apolipoprotein N-acyltransferase [Alkalimarinus alittae]
MISKSLLITISILLILVSFPGGEFPLLVCIAVAPALIATASLNPIQSALALGVWAWIWWLAALGWAIPSLAIFSESSAFISILSITLACFTLAIPYALSGFLIAYFRLWKSSLSLLQIPLCFAILISLFSTVLPAAPVNALFEYPILLQWADIGGLPILLFFYFIFNTSIASIFIHKKDRAYITIVMLIFIPMMVLSYGQYKLSEEAKTNTTKITFGYIQPLAHSEDKLSHLISQTHKLKQVSEQLELVIWPEVPVDFSWYDNQYERYRIRKLAQEIDAHLIILSGFHYANNINAEGGHYNSATFISNNGSRLAEYRKQKLVPIFEYLPFKNYLSPFFPSARNYIAGIEPILFNYKDRSLAPLICYEVLFSDLVKPYVDDGADIIINPGNDGWFGRVGALSHLSLALLRTIEYRIPLIRVNNSGVSTVINHKGEILFDTLSMLDTQMEKSFSLEIAKGEHTFFYQYGSILNLLGILLFCLSLLFKRDKVTLRTDH